MSAFRGPSSSDVLAGASVAFIVIPQALAYADLAGVPAQAGLFAAALPPVLAAFFVSSKYLQTGPVALTALLTYGALEGLAEPFSPEYVRLAALLAVLVGLTRVMLGLFRLGGVAYLLSEPVLTGFTTGAAFLIISSQLPKTLGVEGGGGGVLANAFDSLTSPGSWRLSSMAFALATVVAVVGGRKIHKLFPGVLFAVIGGVIVSSITGYSGSTIGDLPGGFLSISASFPWASVGTLLPAALLIGLIGFAEPSSIARVFATAERTPWDANKEMISQGVANLTSGLSGGFPIGGSFSRSSLNHAAGASSAWSGAITGLVVIAALPLTPLLANLPTAVLGALIITGVAKLIDVRSLAGLFRESPAQAVVGVGTLIATLALAPRVERGVLVGIVLALAVHLYREMSVTVSHEVSAKKLIIRPQGVLWFAAVPRIDGVLRALLAEHVEIAHVDIDLTGVGRLDYSGAAALERVVEEVRSSGTIVTISNVPPGAQRAFTIHLEGQMSDRS